MPEQYQNLYSTTVAGGGYTSGSGVLNVASTTGVTIPSGNSCRLLVYQVSGGAIVPVVLLKATAVNSSTQFAVTAEGSDTNASASDGVVMVLSSGAMSQIRSDMVQAGTRASLPATTGQIAANRYLTTDSCYKFRFNGSIWVPWVDGRMVTEPLLANYTWANQGGATTDTTFGGLALNVDSQTGSNLRILYQAAPSTPYSIIAGFRSAITGVNYQFAGLCFYDTSGGAVHICGGIGDNSGLTVFSQLYSNFTTAGVTYYQKPAYVASTLWLKIRDDGTNRSTYWSPDRVYWYLMSSISRTSGMTPSAVGIYGSTSASAQAFTSWCLDWTQTP